MRGGAGGDGHGSAGRRGGHSLLAYYAACQASPVRLVHDRSEFLAPLPLAVAEPTAPQAEILRGWGVATLGQLTALPKAQVAERLGTDGVRLWERAAGETTRVLELVEPARTFMAEWDYEPPIESMEPLLFRLRRFAECVALELRGAGLVAEKSRLSCYWRTTARTGAISGCRSRARAWTPGCVSL